MQSYQGTADHPSLSDTENGPITVQTKGIVLSYDDQTAVLPLEGLLVTAGGFNDQMILFSHPAHPGWSISTSDRTILENTNLLNQPGIASQIASLNKKESKIRTNLLIAAALILTLIVGLFLSKERLVSAAARRVPASWEKQIGELSMGSMKGRIKFVEDTKLRKDLGTIIDQITSANAGSRYEYTLSIAQDKNINAFALPGGFIVVNTGLIRAARSSEELAGVLAHEIAHVTKQHGIRQLISTAGLSILVSTFFGDASGIVAVLTQNSAFLLTQKYSRDYEREADDIGWQSLVDARIDPQGMIDFFDTLLQKEQKATPDGLGDLAEKPLSILSTHPLTSERIERLQKKYAKLSSSETFLPLEITIDSLQNQLSEENHERNMPEMR